MIGNICRVVRPYSAWRQALAGLPPISIPLDKAKVHARVIKDGYLWVRLQPEDVSLTSIYYQYDYAYEHRLIMARALGRILLPSEIVHHKDGVRYHNNLENLMLLNSIGEHLKLHAEIRKNKRLEDNYGR